FQAEDGIRDRNVTGVQTCALPISPEHALSRDQVMRRIGSLMERLSEAGELDDTLRKLSAKSSRQHIAVEELEVIAAIAEAASSYREELIGIALDEGATVRHIAKASQRSHSVIVRRKQQLGKKRKQKGIGGE